jgi:hypothetical protein
MRYSSGIHQPCSGTRHLTWCLLHHEAQYRHLSAMLRHTTSHMMPPTSCGTVLASISHAQAHVISHAVLHHEVQYQHLSAMLRHTSSHMLPPTSCGTVLASISHAQQHVISHAASYTMRHSTGIYQFCTATCHLTCCLLHHEVQYRHLSAMLRHTSSHMMPPTSCGTVLASISHAQAHVISHAVLHHEVQYRHLSAMLRHTSSHMLPPTP